MRYFLFEGGPYKRGIDDGRRRVPLTPEEAGIIFADPELSGNYEDNSIKARFNFADYADVLCHLAVGDEIMVGLVPDAAVYRGLWGMNFLTVPGFVVKLDLVSVADIFEADEGVAVAGTEDLTLPAIGVGQATCDALQSMKLYGGDFAQYRNESALFYTGLDPHVFAGLGKAMYIRLTVESIGEYNADDCCDNCGNNMPFLEVGAIYDRLCVDKQYVQPFCNCNKPICSAGCSDDAEVAEAEVAEAEVAEAEVAEAEVAEAEVAEAEVAQP